jgi:tRNA (guanosine-2'-O-)-methyltransferase
VRVVDEDTEDLPATTVAAYPADAWRLLAPRMTERRRQRIGAAAAARTRHVRLVVQDIHHPHNVAACLRSAEAFGVQDVDVVVVREAGFRASGAARGVAEWLTIRRHPSVAACAAALRRDGYRIACGLPKQDAPALFELPVATKLAVVFGNEHAGVDPDWLPFVDTPFTIPMAGLVESLNISVCAAITLCHLTRASRAALSDEAYRLPPGEQEALLNAWACRQTPHWEKELGRLRSR